MAIVAAATHKYLLPALPHLKSELISIVTSWIFYTVIFFLFLIVLIIWRRYLAWKAEQLRLKEIAEAELRKEQKAEEEYKKAHSHLFPGTIYEGMRKANELKDRCRQWSNTHDEVGAEVEEEEPPRRKHIRVDLTQEFHKRKKYNKDEIDYLITKGYKDFKYKSICTGKVENYLLRPRFNESLNHMIVIYDLEEYLKKKKIDVEKYTTKMPDLVLYLDKEDIAIEVETGTVIRNMKKFNEKLRLLKENYGENFYFIVTNRNLIKKYRAYGKVIDPRYIKGQIDKILKNSEK